MNYGGWNPDLNPGIEANEFADDCGRLIQSDQKLHVALQRIYKLYLSESAQFEINLSSTVSMSIRKCFNRDGSLNGNSPQNVFQLLCEAQNEIFMLMQNDSYVVLLFNAHLQKLHSFFFHFFSSDCI